jgi:hypothetical protein
MSGLHAGVESGQQQPAVIKQAAGVGQSACSSYQCHSATVPQCHSATVPQCHSAFVTALSYELASSRPPFPLCAHSACVLVRAYALAICAVALPLCVVSVEYG